MPDYSKYARLRTPRGKESAVVPADLKLLVDGFDSLLNLRATDEADRDARYGDAPIGTLVSTTERGILYWRAPSGWIVAARDPFRIDDILQPRQDWSPQTNFLLVSSSNIATLYLTLVYQGSSPISVPSDGNIKNQTVGTIDLQYAPPTIIPLTMTTTGRMNSGACSSSGDVALVAVAPGGDINSGDTIQLVGSWPL